MSSLARSAASGALQGQTVYMMNPAGELVPKSLYDVIRGVTPADVAHALGIPYEPLLESVYQPITPVKSAAPPSRERDETRLLAFINRHLPTFYRDYPERYKDFKQLHATDIMQFIDCLSLDQRKKIGQNQLQLMAQDWNGFGWEQLREQARGDPIGRYTYRVAHNPVRAISEYSKEMVMQLMKRTTQFDDLSDDVVRRIHACDDMVDVFKIPGIRDLFSDSEEIDLLTKFRASRDELELY